MAGGALSARRLCVLLLLSAVFSLHGVQCVAADAEAGHRMTGAAHALVDVPATLPSADGPLAVLDHVRPDAAAAVGGLIAVAWTPEGGLPVHHDPWAVCLTVVLAGLVALGTVALVRKEPVVVARARAPSVLWHTGWSSLPRPPDLSSLCLLRI